MGKTNKKPQIMLSAQNFICKETAITLSDVNMIALLSKAYEKAVENCNKKRFCNYYQIPLSASFTLFFSLVTSQYNQILGIPADTVKTLVIVIAVGLLVCGIGMFLTCYEKNQKKESAMRDDSVDQIMKSLIKIDEE